MEKTFTTRKREKVRPNQKQGFTGCGRNVAGGMPASARTGAGAQAWNAHGYAGARGEGAANATVGEADRW